ncbi:MAG: hypothetical protein LBB79_09820 [Prevotellaceae bacterium]|jgi:hypothetical protein|nr:hypothetical protein [Prevotellaceae bacterium]
MKKYDHEMQIPGLEDACRAAQADSLTSSKKVHAAIHAGFVQRWSVAPCKIYNGAFSGWGLIEYPYKYLRGRNIKFSYKKLSGMAAYLKLYLRELRLLIPCQDYRYTSTL